jgi:hypothetical protein
METAVAPRDVRIRKLVKSILVLSTGVFSLTSAFVNLMLVLLETGLNPANSLPRKRKRYLEINYTTLYFYLQNIRSQNRYIYCEWYIKPRTIQWFYLYLDYMPISDPVRFKEFFRVSPPTFEVICDMVHSSMITRPPQGLRLLPNRLLSVRRQVAIAIRKLSTGDQFLGVAELFGLSVTSVQRITQKFIKAVCEKGKRLIHWPTGDELAEVKRGFFVRWGFPNCCGAIDGTHFPIQLPHGDMSPDYFDFKKKLSVSLQGVADINLKFLDIITGWPGSVQDSRLLAASRFYKDVEYYKTKLNTFEYYCSDGETVLREYILGDSGYPLLPWLMTPYARDLSEETDDWNYRQSQARMCIERAFGVLKGRWQILNRVLWRIKADRIGPLIYCCCLLHNLMVDRGETLNPELVARAHPYGYGSVGVPRRMAYAEGFEMRDNLLNEVLFPRPSTDL